MSLFQASEDRPSLACTSFEIRKVGNHHELTLASIDGKRLASYQTEIMQDTLWGELPDSEQIVVSLEGCNKLPKVEITDCVRVEVYQKHVEFIADAIRYTATRLETEESGIKFPAWRGVIPSKPAERVEQIAVNHELLADFGKAAKLIVGDKGYGIALRTYGEGSPISVQFTACREFYGIIMPLKSDHPEAFPEWLRDDAKITKADLRANNEIPKTDGVLSDDNRGSWSK
jgi:hypothetical protein